MPNLDESTQRSMTSSQIVEWDSATTPKAREATLHLFTAVGQGDLPAVQRWLEQGGRPNAVRREGDGPSQSLLDFALQLETHDEQGPRNSPMFTENPVTGARTVVVSTGIPETLMAAGATTEHTPREVFQGLFWDRHPACQALEHAHLNTMNLERWALRFSKPAREQGLCESVMPDSREQYDQSWLHRALLHRRWDVVKAWIDHDLALNFTGSDSVCTTLLNQYFLEQNPVKVQDTLHGLNVLRPGLLAESDHAYHGEIHSAVVTIAHYAPPPFTDKLIAKCRMVIDWVGDLLLERNAPCVLTDEDADNSPGQQERAHEILRTLETRVLRSALQDHAQESPFPIPTRVRSRL